MKVSTFSLQKNTPPMPNINRELEQTQTSPLRQSQKIQQLLQNQSTLSRNDTQKLLSKQRKFKDKSQLFDPMPALNESKRLDTILPRLKQNMTGHNQREIYLLHQQSLDMRKNLNDLINDNQKMAKSLKHLKQIEGQQSSDINSNQVVVARQRLEEIQRKITETQDGYYFCVMQIERFKTILRISDENKKQNQEWIRYLNYLLNNLNKMIKFEQESIKKCAQETQQLKKIDQEYNVAFREKMKNHDRLISQIKFNLQNKKNMDNFFGRCDNIIEKSAFQQIEKMKSDQQHEDQIRKQRERQEKQQTKQKDIGSQLQEQQQDYEKLEQIFDDQIFNYQKTEKFQQFQANQEKESDLKAILLERDDIIYDLEYNLQEKEYKLEILKKAQEQRVLKQKNPQKQTIKLQEEQIKKEKQKQENKQETQQQQNQEIKDDEKKQVEEKEEKKEENKEKELNQEQNQNKQETQNEAEPLSKQNSQKDVQKDQEQDQKETEKQENEKVENKQQDQDASADQQDKGNKEEQNVQESKPEQENQNEQPPQVETKQQIPLIEDNDDSDSDEENDEELPSDLEQLQLYYDNRRAQNQKLEQIRLSLVGIIQTSQKKLDINQSLTVKQTINFDLEELQQSLEQKMIVIKEKLEEEDYNKFINGNFDKNQMYKGLIQEVSEYGYDEEDPGDDAFENSSKDEESQY